MGYLGNVWNVGNIVWEIISKWKETVGFSEETQIRPFSFGTALVVVVVTASGVVGYKLGTNRQKQQNKNDNNRQLFARFESTTERKTKVKYSEQDFEKLKNSEGLVTKHYGSNVEVHLLKESCELEIIQTSINLEKNPTESEVFTAVRDIIAQRTFGDETTVPKSNQKTHTGEDEQ